MITADHNFLSESLWISKQSSTCSRGAGLGHPMDPVISVQNTNFSGNTKELAKVPGTREETKSHLHWQFLGIWQSLWRSFLESLYVDTTQIGNKWDCWKSSAQSERRYLCSNGATRSGWKLVGGFHGMFAYLRNVTDLLSDGKTPYERHFGQPFEGPICSICFTGWILAYHSEGPVKNPSIWKVRGGNLEGWRIGCRSWGVGNDGRIRNLLKKDSMRKRWYFPKENLFFQSQMDESNVLEEIRTWEHPPWYGIDQLKGRKSRRFSWRIRRVSFTTWWLVSGCRWSDTWLLVPIRKLHVPPSRWTKSQTLLTERRIIPCSTEIQWRLQNYKNKFGCYAGAPHRWLLEHRWIRRCVWSLDRFHTIFSIGRETSKRTNVVREDWQNGRWHPGQIFMARILDKVGKKC